MLTRSHTSHGVVSTVQYSDCEAYRYTLCRVWADADNLVNFIMLNPSVADEHANDPTVERCERRARMMGFEGFIVTNIFAWRDTDPRAMRRAKRPIGPVNDTVLQERARQARQVIAAWGVHGAHRGRGEQVRGALAAAGVRLHHLGLSKHGHPRHPLYLPYTQTPSYWDEAPNG